MARLRARRVPGRGTDLGAAASRERRRDADSEGSDPRIATTLARGLRILGAFRVGDRGPLGNKELAARTGLPKATVSRLTYTLTKLGFVAQDPRSGGFSLAAGVLAPAYAFLARLDVRSVARPLMQQLASHPNVTVTLATRHELRMATIEAVVMDGQVPLGLFGGSAPIARTALGHAYLAGLSPQAREPVMAAMRAHYADEWPTIEKRIRRDITNVEASGYCVVLGEWSPDINGVAAPVVIGNGGLVLSMSAGGPAKLLPGKLLEEIGGRMRQICRKLEQAVGRPGA
jgi:DNA-binding IclR family transcriptional regulator